jgi:hypothetical protein
MAIELVACEGQEGLAPLKGTGIRAEAGDAFSQFSRRNQPPPAGCGREVRQSPKLGGGWLLQLF